MCDTQKLRPTKRGKTRIDGSRFYSANTCLFNATHRIDRASVAVSASRIASGDEMIACDEPMSLSEYDAVFKEKAG